MFPLTDQNGSKKIPGLKLRPVFKLIYPFLEGVRETHKRITIDPSITLNQASGKEASVPFTTFSSCLTYFNISSCSFMCEQSKWFHTNNINISCYARRDRSDVQKWQCSTWTKYWLRNKTNASQSINSTSFDHLLWENDHMRIIFSFTRAQAYIKLL